MAIIKTFPGGTTVEVNTIHNGGSYRVCSASGSVCHLADNDEKAVNFADVFEHYYTVSRH
jgi:hypothetical protein